MHAVDNVHMLIGAFLCVHIHSYCAAHSIQGVTCWSIAVSMLVCRYILYCMSAKPILWCGTNKL